MSDYLSLPDAAQHVGCSRHFLWRRCKAGELPAIKIGKEYRVRLLDVEHLTRNIQGAKAPQRSQTYPASDILVQADSWLAYLINVQALSPSTITVYKGMIRNYLKRLSDIEQSPLSLNLLFERRSVMAVFSRIPAKSFNLKNNTYIALRSFGRYLVLEGKLSQSVLDELKAVKPRRQSEPRRTHLKPEDVSRLFDVILTRRKGTRDNLAMAAMVAVMVYAGLRVSEVCGLRACDVDLESRILVVRHGKGGKDRRVGINNGLMSYLVEYARVRTQGAAFFVDSVGDPFTKDRMAHRMQSISKRLGVDITCHGLRRTFATLAANQGRSINSIRIALGHSNLETTQAYLRTSEQEVVEAMKGW